MARKETIVKIQDRDQDLTFKIREMSATKLESWIIRVLLLVAGSGAVSSRLPGAMIKEISALPAEKALAALGNVDFEKARPLLDELLGCCSRVTQNVEEHCTPDSVDAYILDVTTLFNLRVEALKLNLGFLGPEVAERLSGFPGIPNTETP
jgi:hypothetical protein